jgi:carbon monoxide dehydrogenase subunit G
MRVVGSRVMRLEERILIAAPQTRVWDVLTEWERQAAWMPDVAWLRVLGPPRKLGARLRVKTRVFGIPAATDLLEVTTWDPPRRLAVRHVGVVTGSGEWTLNSVPAGTSFTWVELLHMPPPLLGDLALIVYSPWQRSMLRRSMENLKRLAEEGSG